MPKTEDDTKRELQSILDCLSKMRMRATYGSVATLLGIHTTKLIEFLGEPRPETSWIVNKETGMPGCPPGHPEFPCDPYLKTNDGYITDMKHLTDVLEQCRK